MDERIDSLPRLHIAPTRDILQSQLIKIGVLRQGRALEIQQVIGVQSDVGKHTPCPDQSLAIDQCRGGKLRHLRWRHQCPRLHPKAGLHTPAIAIVRKVNDAVRTLQRAVSREIKRRFTAKTIRAVPRRFRNHRGFMVVSRVHRRMHKLFRLARRARIETQCAAVVVGMSVANRPLAVLPFVGHTEVAMAVNEISRRITQFLERPEHFGAGCGPIACSDYPFETNRTQEGVRFRVKPLLHLEQKLHGVPVARRLFAEHIIERTKADASRGDVIALDLLLAPLRQRGVERAVFFLQPVSKLRFENSHLRVRDAVRIERPEEE